MAMMVKDILYIVMQYATTLLLWWPIEIKVEVNAPSMQRNYCSLHNK